MRTFLSPLVYGLPLLALVTACANGITSAPPVGNGVGVASLQARPEPPTPPEPRTTYDPRGTLAAEALAEQDYAKVLALTQDTDRAPQGAWLDYDRAMALVGLRRTDDALAAFSAAEHRFRTVGDETALAVAIWGKGRALVEAGRCTEARRAFEDFAALVGQTDPRSAQMAAARSADCRGPVVQR
jgi:hypothetical protein